MSKINNNLKLLTAFLFFMSTSVSAQQLVPATSEDEEMFEQQLQMAEKSASKKVTILPVNQKKVDSAQFKEFVNSEAKKLKDATVDDRTQQGQNVAAQKRKNLTQGQGTSAGSQGNSSNSNRDGRISAPIFNNSGGAADSPGKSGNRPKK